MMTEKKTNWQVGDTGWEVEWCYECTPDPDCPDDHCADNDKYRQRRFRTKEQALECAKKVFPHDKHGYVTLTPFVVEYIDEELCLGLQIEHTADSECYEGD